MGDKKSLFRPQCQSTTTKGQNDGLKLLFEIIFVTCFQFLIHNELSDSIYCFEHVVLGCYT